MRAFTRLADSCSFTSRIDSKGRALLSADVRNKLCLKFGSKVAISAKDRFSTKIDERGRFVVPVRLRCGSSVISGKVSVVGRDSSACRTEDCGSSNPGSNPGRGLENSRGWKIWDV